MGIERDVNRTNADVMASDEFTSAALPMIHVVQDALSGLFQRSGRASQLRKRRREQRKLEM
jgi:hypothetical protein